MKEHGPWKIKESVIKYKNPWIEVREDKVIRPDGKSGIFGVVNMKHGISVLPMDDEGFVYLTEEFNEGSQWIGFVLAGFFLISISLVGFLNIISTCEVIEQDKIIVHRWFQKRNIYFKDIRSYSFKFNQLTVWCESEHPVLFIGDNRLGVKNIIDALESKGKYRGN